MSKSFVSGALAKMPLKAPIPTTSRRIDPVITAMNNTSKKENKNSATSREKIPKNTMKNNYIVDGGLPKKMNKYLM